LCRHLETDVTEKAPRFKPQPTTPSTPLSARRTVGVRRSGRANEDRRREIVRKTADLFLERGYADVSIDEIISRVGGSKGTIYTWFGGKEGLFEAVVKLLCSGVTIAIVADAKGDIESQLTRIGNSFLAMVLSPPILELHRLMVSMGRTFPSAGKMFFDAGPITAYRTVASWIEAQQRARLIAPADPYQLAVLFLDMIIGEHQLRMLVSLPKDAQSKRIKETVRSAVGLFLNGCRERAR
jgi:TetR/AcrR family transcriptional repressor of mexJK operon